MARVVHTPHSSGWSTTAVPDSSSAVPLRGDRAGEWHGQEGQDRIVAMLLGGSSTQGGLEQRNARFFVDLASSNGLTHSNTRTLERDHGWRGLCIEANSRFWPARRRTA